MKQRRQWRRFPLAVALLAGAFSMAVGNVALAHGREAGKPDDHRGRLPGIPLPGKPCPSLGQRIDPNCKALCDAQERNCKAAARQELSTCLTTNCAEALEAARAACSAAPASEECTAAWQAYIACAQPCFQAFRAARATCDADERACKANCPPTSVPCLPVVDPVCTAQCRATHSTCIAAAQQAAVACYAGCRELSATARSVCSANPNSDDCRAALSALRACLFPCDTNLRQSTATCKADAQMCVQACRTTPTP